MMSRRPCSVVRVGRNLRPAVVDEDDMSLTQILMPLGYLSLAFTYWTKYSANNKMILAAEECGCPIVTEGPSIVNSPICGGTFLFMTLLQGFLWGRCDIADPCRRVVSQESVDEYHDFIVVGAGSAGSIVAARLAANETYTVLLLEAGGPDPIGSRVPSFYRTFWSNQQVDWDYRTVPGNYCLDQEGKGCSWPRGKVLGGSSVLNGMMYHRGHPADYEAWVNAGATGWGWEDNLKYFDMTEGNRQIGSLVSEKHHSASGPLPVQQFNYQPPAVYQLLDAINETGFPIITDMNDLSTPEGFTIAQTFNDNGQRFTTARAYLSESSVITRLNAHVTKVIMEGKQAKGVEYMDNKGETHTAYASKEVILSAGALNSPHILLLSGIGPKETLLKNNITVVEDLPVGQNLINHIGATLYFTLPAVNDTRVLDWANAAEYLLTRQGPMSSTGLTQLTGLLYSSLANKTREQPDMQFFFNGFYADCSHTGQPGEEATNCSQNGMNVTANGVYLLAKSEGYLTLNSSDPLDPPIFEANYFDDPEDMLIVKEALRVLHKIFSSQTLQDKYQIALDSEHTSPCDDLHEQWSEDWLECIIRLNTDPQNHQLGTAAMGPVLDTTLKIHNIIGLRVIDASSMPSSVTGNPQGAIMMVAERGASLILQEYAR